MKYPAETAASGEKFLPRRRSCRFFDFYIRTTWVGRGWTTYALVCFINERSIGNNTASTGMKHCRRDDDVSLPAIIRMRKLFLLPLRRKLFEGSYRALRSAYGSFLAFFFTAHASRNYSSEETACKSNAVYLRNEVEY